MARNSIATTAIRDGFAETLWIDSNIGFDPDDVERLRGHDFPVVREYRGGHWYIGEDFSFCERARQCGYSIMADTSIRLWHIGSYPYGWEDAGVATNRYNSFEFQFGAEHSESN